MKLRTGIAFSGLCVFAALAVASVSEPEAEADSFLCTVSGTVTRDLSDTSNGHKHYKGKLDFKANAAMAGVNIYVPKCTCLDCPSLSGNALGIRPGSTFASGESRSYRLDCESDTFQGGTTGTASIDRMVPSPSNPKAGTWVAASCGGTFDFKEPTVKKLIPLP